jgi:aryl-alcohol dehydrogenase-like predicted oxidoreductase
MRRTRLGRSGIEVSAFCLGTMTFGTNTDEAEAHRQLDYSLDVGIDFLDTAEMYPVNPVLKETVGLTEEIIGRWCARTGRRGDYVIATKCAGLNGRFVREDQPVTGAIIREACEASLRRLQTDWIDLYQLHWPNRGSYHFRQIWGFDPSGQDRAATLAHMEDVTGELGRLAEEGKIRAFGLSNESAWGTMQWIAAGERAGGPRVAAIQNEYSPLCRMPYDGDMAELGVHEDVTLLAFSPLATGFVTGKYLDGARPAGSRQAIAGGSPRSGPRVDDAVRAYLAVAEAHGLDPVHMALAFCLQRPFPCIPIFGATTTAQLEQNFICVDACSTCKRRCPLRPDHGAGAGARQ